jgi:hypothetical protein
MVGSGVPAAGELAGELGAIVARALERRVSAHELARQLCRAIHRRHQFAPIDAGAKLGLERACEAALAGSDEPSSLVQIALELVPSGQPAVVSAEYDPLLQLTLLGLDLDALEQPLLDLGSGYEARLVKALRARGIEAVALDRYLEPGAGIEADFLAHPLEPASWGTIVSHQAFSLHFIYQHLASAEQAARYAERMLEILRALKSGGSFAYAPGLPFFEPLLARAGFSLTRAMLPRDLAARIPCALAEQVGADVAYACRIRRR